MKDNCLWITQFFCSSITLRCIKPPFRLHSPSGHPHPPCPSTAIVPSCRCDVIGAGRSWFNVKAALWIDVLHFPSELFLPSDFETIAFTPAHHGWCYENKMIISGSLLKPCVHGLLLLFYSQSWHSMSWFQNSTSCVPCLVFYPFSPPLFSLAQCPGNRKLSLVSPIQHALSHLRILTHIVTCAWHAFPPSLRPDDLIIASLGRLFLPLHRTLSGWRGISIHSHTLRSFHIITSRACIHVQEIFSKACIT